MHKSVHDLVMETVLIMAQRMVTLSMRLIIYKTIIQQFKSITDISPKNGILLESNSLFESQRVAHHSLT